ncbi:helix-turn-helix domain-containing protein [Ectopseudomonas hydrolytica]|uniref:helix-turn-helix domain-containing protein n=1 Tax=Ectopseudomonas hydrolytica TaxID=2493633 RepID=UPI00376F36C9
MIYKILNPYSGVRACFQEKKIPKTVLSILFMGYVYVLRHVKHPKNATPPGGMDHDMNTAEIPSDPALRWEWIKFQLRARGTSLAKLARALNVSGPAVKNVKRTAYPRMERAIAKALDVNVEQLWPERWDANGNPNRQRPKRPETMPARMQKHNAAYDLGHRKTVAEV